MGVPYIGGGRNARSIMSALSNARATPRGSQTPAYRVIFRAADDDVRSHELNASISDYTMSCPADDWVDDSLITAGMHVTVLRDGRSEGRDYYIANFQDSEQSGFRKFFLNRM